MDIFFSMTKLRCVSLFVGLANFIKQWSVGCFPTS